MKQDKIDTNRIKADRVKIAENKALAEQKLQERQAVLDMCRTIWQDANATPTLRSTATTIIEATLNASAVSAGVLPQAAPAACSATDPAADPAPAPNADPAPAADLALALAPAPAADLAPAADPASFSPTTGCTPASELNAPFPSAFDFGMRRPQSAHPERQPSQTPGGGSSRPLSAYPQPPYIGSGSLRWQDGDFEY
ncbi:hypothetical protein FRC09_002552 [Ceratobasidium sp. 395]|nr:hypothetical protein FRC09_002552 [Ceratobasidium sp. 395]